MKEHLSDIPKLNILIADDHPVFCKGLTEIIRRQNLVGNIYEVHDGLQVMLLMKEHKIDIAFLDYRMPKMDGDQCLQKIRSNYSHVKVIIVSMIDEAPLILRMIHEGAQGYILKNKIGSEISQAFKAVLNGERYFDNDVKKLIENYEEALQPLHQFKTTEKLTPREFEILELVALGRTSNNIADTLFINFETVNHHRQNGMHKINAKNNVDVTRYFIGNAFMTVDDFLKNQSTKTKNH